MKLQLLQYWMLWRRCTDDHCSGLFGSQALKREAMLVGHLPLRQIHEVDQPTPLPLRRLETQIVCRSPSLQARQTSTRNDAEAWAAWLIGPIHMRSLERSDQFRESLRNLRGVGHLTFGEASPPVDGLENEEVEPNRTFAPRHHTSNNTLRPSARYADATAVPLERRPKHGGCPPAFLESRQCVEYSSEWVLQGQSRGACRTIVSLSSSRASPALCPAGSNRPAHI